MNERGEVQINVSAIHLTHSNKEDPMLAQVKKSINRYFFPRTRLNQSAFIRDSEDTTIMLTRKYSDGPFTFLMQITSGSATYYSINGKRQSREATHNIMAKILLKMCFSTSASVMYEYLSMLMEVPARVVHALENRTVYKFYDEGRRIEVRLNTKRISQKECALEISDSLWLPISNKDLDSFIKYHREDNQRNKKWNVAPINLIRILNPEAYYKMAASTQNVMNAFLMQNRTQKLVEERAQKLLSEMTEKFPTKLFTYKEPVEFQEKMATAMLVSGNLADYFIVPNHGTSRGHQNVSVFVVHGPNTTHGEGFTRKDYATRGPVCIDNIHNNSSIGDQIMSRALALMNDEAAVNAIHTLRTNLPTEPYRVDRERLRGDSE
tara:strand:+ start:2555 stop:3691 length:1137 start_codon:yes stop_codon:yes gene_type:complete